MRLGRRHLDPVVTACGHERVVIEQVAPSRLEGASDLRRDGRERREAHDVLECRALGKHLRDGGQLIGLDEHDGDVGVVDLELDDVLAERVVDGHARVSLRHHAERHDLEGHAVRRVHAKRRILGEAKLSDAGCEVEHASVDLLVRDPLEGAELITTRHRVQRPVSEAVVLWVHFCRPRKHCVEVVDIRTKLGLRGRLGRGQPPRHALARLGGGRRLERVQGRERSGRGGAHDFSSSDA